MAGQRAHEIASEVARTEPVVAMFLSLALVAVVTVLLLVVSQFFELEHVAIGYLIPVLIAAVRWGVLPAVVSAIAGVGASAFFFYAPIYSFQVSSPQHVADLVMFVLVAVVTGQLTTSLRAHADAARKREGELKALHFFSRRLAGASGPTDIYSAIQDHLTAITRRRVVLFEANAERSRLETSSQWLVVPAAVRHAVVEIAEGARCRAPIEPAASANWLIRTVSQRTSTLGIIAIDMEGVAERDLAPTRHSVDLVVAEAEATLERIDVANVIAEARVRSEAQILRDALVGSVSHELRTPLAAIVGSSSILVEAPAIASDARLSELAGVVRDEAERLNGDIQNLLDASRISSAGLRARLEWHDPADVINAAVERCGKRHPGRRIVPELPGDLPLVFVDAVLIEQALRQVVDNAAKYSEPGSTIRISAHGATLEVVIAVSDQGAGLSSEERHHIWERFYRGERQSANVLGSGLGLWIAQAFVTACGGKVAAESPGIGRGTTVTVRLPAPDRAPDALSGAPDE